MWPISSQIGHTSARGREKAHPSRGGAAKSRDSKESQPDYRSPRADLGALALLGPALFFGRCMMRAKLVGGTKSSAVRSGVGMVLCAAMMLIIAVLSTSTVFGAQATDTTQVTQGSAAAAQTTSHTLPGDGRESPLLRVMAHFIFQGRFRGCSEIHLSQWHLDHHRLQRQQSDMDRHSGPDLRHCQSGIGRWNSGSRRPLRIEATVPTEGVRHGRPRERASYPEDSSGPDRRIPARRTPTCMWTLSMSRDRSPKHRPPL